MAKSIPITSKAKANYKAAPSNQEVTIDPKGKVVGDFESISKTTQEK
jgi:hypothetical protein